MPDNYQPIPLPSDADTLLAEAVARVQLTFPDWEPSAGQLDYVMMVAIAYMDADMARLAVAVPDAIYKQLGTSLFSVPFQDAEAAQGLGDYRAAATICRKSLSQGRPVILIQ